MLRKPPQADANTHDPELFRTLEVAHGVDWMRGSSFVDYPAAVAAMEARVEAIRQGAAREAVWFLEHPPVYTAGTSARPEELLNQGGIPVHRTGRGGRFTYHGPGQRVVYVMLDLRRRGQDVRAHVCRLEQWIIDALSRLGVHGERRRDRIGIWVVRDDGREEKIAAIGVRVRRWVTYHGMAINVSPDLAHFQGIVPCGITGHGVTSLRDLGVEADMGVLDAALSATYSATFLQMNGS
ncbi:MAG: lipoyl(octanoyl) transferase LipB [Rhodospirillales bacterium]|nr:lipoyl(octanoyl) transferase LipB [Rhodospirillales bacterium]